MNTYTVTAVSDNVRTWNTKAGAPWKSYRVTLRNHEGRELENVEVSRNASAPAPHAGESVEGTVDKSGQYGPKLVEPKKGGGGFSRAKSPEERRSIAMQASQKVAVDVVKVEIDYGVKCDDIPQAVLDYAQRLFEQVQRAEAGS